MMEDLGFYTSELHDSDVLLGRGMCIAKHPGNVLYRLLVQQHRTRYLQTSHRQSKKNIAIKICSILRNDYGARFLREVKTSAEREQLLSENRFSATICMGKIWRFVDEATILRKIKHALREKCGALYDAEPSLSIRSVTAVTETAPILPSCFDGCNQQDETMPSLPNDCTATTTRSFLTSSDSNQRGTCNLQNDYHSDSIDHAVNVPNCNEMNLQLLHWHSSLIQRNQPMVTQVLSSTQNTTFGNHSFPLSYRDLGIQNCSEQNSNLLSYMRGNEVTSTSWIHPTIPAMYILLPIVVPGLSG